MPAGPRNGEQGITGLTLHLFTRREAERLLIEAGFRLRAVQPLSLRPDSRLPLPGGFGWLAHPFLRLPAGGRTTPSAIPMTKSQ
jgi:hypothetical protein